MPTDHDDDKTQSTPSVESGDSRQERRRSLKQILAGGGVAGAAFMVPGQWAKPVVERVMLPAHAQTTGALFAGGTTLIAFADPADGSDEIPRLADEDHHLIDHLLSAAHAGGEGPVKIDDIEVDVCVEDLGNGRARVTIIAYVEDLCDVSAFRGEVAIGEGLQGIPLIYQSCGLDDRVRVSVAEIAGGRAKGSIRLSLDDGVGSQTGSYNIGTGNCPAIPRVDCCESGEYPEFPTQSLLLKSSLRVRRRR